MCVWGGGGGDLKVQRLWIASLTIRECVIRESVSTLYVKLIDITIK